MTSYSPPSNAANKTVHRAVGTGTLERALAALISSPEYEPGMRIPTERELAERFNVSRGTVRAALSRMEGRGEIVRIMGSGTYVADRHETDTNPEQVGDASPQEIMGARLMVEPSMLPLVVLHASKQDLIKIRHALEQSEAASDHDSFERWDAEFHKAIAEATHNRLVVDIYRTVTEARNLTEWGELKRRTSTPERRKAREAEHRKIFDALMTRDAIAAQQAMQQHLMIIRSELLSSDGSDFIS
jgi:DNA-binding FadR family transcriptional regulator